MTAFTILMGIAVIIFLLAAINYPRENPINVTALGLFFTALAFAIGK